jgi:hypothetical protein
MIRRHFRVHEAVKQETSSRLLLNVGATALRGKIMLCIFAAVRNTDASHVNLKSSVMYDIAPCSLLKVSRRFGEWRFHLHGHADKPSRKPKWKHVASRILTVISFHVGERSDSTNSHQRTNSEISLHVKYWDLNKLIFPSFFASILVSSCRTYVTCFKI